MERKVIAESQNIRLICNGAHHWSEDKRSGVMVPVPVQKCDCKKEEATMPAPPNPDHEDIRIRPIKNGIMVRCGADWIYARDLAAAFKLVEIALENRK